MKTTFKKSFIKDLKKYIKDESILSRIQDTILELEAAESILSIKNLKKLKEKSSYYRIRIGHYRWGSLSKKMK